MRRLGTTALVFGALVPFAGPAVAEPIDPQPLPHSRGGPWLDPQGERPGSMPQVAPGTPGPVPIPLLRPPPLDPVPIPEAGQPRVDGLEILPQPPRDPPLGRGQ